ncbi:hypothetical protein [Pseudobacteriovorax antillogorgiicola]|uniref:Uncharacterized protein n=1 Tax=Pseudobacteriovorax antillogorgiicola TaxID=1513793 RepID=A0A1Y6BL38_9BACT|nr:hypothetical protein [Pseudobacteriovorax antillogorgiicola]TCS54658.1 hypothetical protein EDD56_106171 [Pseudobacteriovorax antillogorgiicola]SMF16839.1 hypothetical protein SAMN06296036_10672 [Pseudobacteriovorax antillogorgiicola]
MKDRTFLIQALRQTAIRLRSEDTKYQWGHMGQCNAGHLVQSLTGLSDREIVAAVDNEMNEWTEHARTFCQNTGSCVDDLFYEIEQHGLDHQAIIHLENLSDTKILKNLAGGFRYLERNRRDDVIAYMESMADLMEKDVA